MGVRQKNITLELLFEIVLIYASAFLVNEIVETTGFFDFGKDGGLIFRLVCTCMVGGVFFFLVRGDGKFSFLLWGFLIGVLGYALTFILYAAICKLLPENHSEWEIPPVVDQLSASTFVLVVGLLYQRRVGKRIEGNGEGSCE